MLAALNPGPAGPPGPEGPQGEPGPAGAEGAEGPAGPGVAAGGTTGQVLAKASAADYATVWADAGTGGGGTVTDVLWTGPEAPVDPTIELWADTDEEPTGGGAAGPQGEPGPQGPQGIQGESGPQGPQGIQGVQGPAGADGADGADAVWVQMTQAAYDALVPKDPGTLYVVIG